MNFCWKGSSREGGVTSLFPKTFFLFWHATVLYKVSNIGINSMLLFTVVNSAVLSNPTMAPGSLHWVPSLVCGNGILRDTGSQYFTSPSVEKPDCLNIWVSLGFLGLHRVSLGSWRQLCSGKIFTRDCHLHKHRVGKGWLRSSFLTTTRKDMRLLWSTSWMWANSVVKKAL